MECRHPVLNAQHSLVTMACKIDREFLFFAYICLYKANISIFFFYQSVRRVFRRLTADKYVYIYRFSYYFAY